MPAITDLDLYEMPLGDLALAEDPNPHFAAARARHPWLARSGFGYVLTDYQAIKDVMSMDDRLRTPAAHIVDIMGGAGTGWGRFQVENLNALSGANHARVRNAVASAFTPRSVNAHREQMRAVVSSLLDEWAPRGEFDFADFASNFPIAVMFGLMGAERRDIPRIKHWLEVVGQSFSLNREIFPELSAAFDDLWAFIDELVSSRQGHGEGARDDLLETLISAETNGQLTRVELRDLVLFLFVAGYDTSKNQLTHIMRLMLEHPAIWARCAEDRAYCAKVVEEAFRHSSVATSYRDVMTAFEHQGVTIPQGTMLIFPFSIAGRDPAAFPNPMRFDPDRSHDQRHTAFGRGMHMCLGQFLARAQIEEGVHLIAKRLRNPSLAGEMLWRTFPGVWGLQSLPIAFDPHPAESGPA